MKLRLLSTVFALAMSAGAAGAADLAYKAVPAAVPTVIPAFVWTGAYVGVQAGYAWNKDHWLNVNGGANSDGLVAGVHGGFNWQVNMLVLGLEGSLAWTDASGSGKCGSFLSFNCKTEHDWKGDVRARAGLAIDRVLVFGAGGLAFDHVKASVRGPYNGSDSNTETGWTVGGGIEWAVTNNWVLGVEYKYTDLGSSNYNFGPETVKIEFETQQVNVRASYKF